MTINFMFMFLFLYTETGVLYYIDIQCSDSLPEETVLKVFWPH